MAGSPDRLRTGIYSVAKKLVPPVTVAGLALSAGGAFAPHEVSAQADQVAGCRMASQEQYRGTVSISSAGIYAGFYETNLWGNNWQKNICIYNNPKAFTFYKIQGTVGPGMPGTTLMACQDDWFDKQKRDVPWICWNLGKVKVGDKIDVFHGLNNPNGTKGEWVDDRYIVKSVNTNVRPDDPSNINKQRLKPTLILTTCTWNSAGVLDGRRVYHDFDKTEVTAEEDSPPIIIPQ